MKILFSPCHYVYDEFYGGSEYSWAFEIANRIAVKNVDSVIVTGFKKINKKKPYSIIEIQKEKKVPDMTLKNAIIFNLKYSLETRKQLKNNFDIIHHVLPFNVYKTFNLSIIFKKKRTLSVIGPIQSPLSFQDTDRLYGGKYWIVYPSKIAYCLLGSILGILSNLTLKNTSAIVVINEYTKNLLINNGVNRDKITIIPPGIDTKKFEYIPFENKKSEKIELLVVCYLVERKAVDLIIKAIAEVVKERSNIILRIVGDGPQRKDLEKMVEELNLKKFIIFEGFVENFKIQEYYKKAHIFLNMSRSEGFATICLEAMSSGLAIISSRVGGFSDAIRDGESGYLVNQEDYIGLSEKIASLLNDTNLISEFGRNARLKAESGYDWDRCIIPKYLDTYKKILMKKNELQ